MREGQERRFSARKARDRSVALLIAGLVLLMPPLAGLALVDDSFGGIPVPLAYVFLVWAALILGTAITAKHLKDADLHGPPDESDKAN